MAFPQNPTALCMVYSNEDCTGTYMALRIDSMPILFRDDEVMMNNIESVSLRPMCNLVIWKGKNNVKFRIRKYFNQHSISYAIFLLHFNLL